VDRVIEQGAFAATQAASPDGDDADAPASVIVVRRHHDHRHRRSVDDMHAPALHG